MDRSSDFRGRPTGLTTPGPSDELRAAVELSNSSDSLLNWIAA